MLLTIVRPRLSPKARLRFDRRTGRHLLLYPETGLELNHTATAIARLCTGEWTVDDMVEQLTQAYDDVSPDEIRREVCGFLDVLSDRGLLQNAHIHDGSSRNRAVAKRDRRAEPRGREAYLKQYVNRPSSEPDCLDALGSRPGLS